MNVRLDTIWMALLSSMVETGSFWFILSSFLRWMSFWLLIFSKNYALSLKGRNYFFPLRCEIQIIGLQSWFFFFKDFYSELITSNLNSLKSGIQFSIWVNHSFYLINPKIYLYRNSLLDNFTLISSLILQLYV